MTETKEKSRKSPPDKGARDSRGRFVKGYGGRKKGARNRATVIAEKLLNSDLEEVARAVVAKAKKGDMAAARLVIERLLPPAKDRAIQIDIGQIETVEDASTALGKIAEAMANGEITPSEASAAGAAIKNFANSVELADLERRLTALEMGTRK